MPTWSGIGDFDVVRRRLAEDVVILEIGGWQLVIGDWQLANSKRQLATLMC